MPESVSCACIPEGSYKGDKLLNFYGESYRNMLYLKYLTRKPGRYRENKARGSGYPFGTRKLCRILCGYDKG